ncbi:MAG: glutaredoxin family protein [Pseudomonadota bacterium]
METKLTLLTREECGLCDQALALVQSLGLHATPVHITTDIELLEKYRNVIPVLTFGNSEIRWPFDQAAIQSLLDAAQ